MARQRVNPHEQGTPERLLHDHWRKSLATANRLQGEATRLQVDADAERAKADHYANALAALGHPVTPLRLEGPK